MSQSASGKSDEARTRGLGRGLSALFDENEESEAASSSAPASKGKGVDLIPIEYLIANPDQPRKTFREEELEELSDSIAEKGLLQPILVRPSKSKPDYYEIVAGERRWRAAQKARLHELPCLIRELTDRETLEIAIVENVQRADLSAVEEARAFKQLIETFGHTQGDVAEAVGKSRTHVTNMLRLLALPDAVLTLLDEGALSAGHARAIANTPNPVQLAREIVDKGLSVRAAEALARHQSSNKSSSKSSARQEKDADTKALEANLAEQLGLDIDLRHKGEKGELRIRYTTLEQLDDLCRRLSQSGSDAY